MRTLGKSEQKMSLCPVSVCGMSTKPIEVTWDVQNFTSIASIVDFHFFQLNLLADHCSTHLLFFRQHKNIRYNLNYDSHNLCFARIRLLHYRKRQKTYSLIKKLLGFFLLLFCSVWTMPTFKITSHIDSDGLVHIQWQCVQKTYF